MDLIYEQHFISLKCLSKCLIFQIQVRVEVRVRKGSPSSNTQIKFNLIVWHTRDFTPFIRKKESHWILDVLFDLVE